MNYKEQRCRRNELGGGGEEQKNPPQRLAAQEILPRVKGSVQEDDRRPRRRTQRGDSGNQAQVQSDLRISGDADGKEQEQKCGLRNQTERLCQPSCLRGKCLVCRRMKRDWYEKVKKTKRAQENKIDYFSLYHMNRLIQDLIIVVTYSSSYRSSPQTGRLEELNI